MSHEQNDQQAQMLRGTAWMTASNFISRLLGRHILFLGIFGWEIWDTSQWSFTMGYNIMWFLLISTAGVPLLRC